MSSQKKMISSPRVKFPGGFFNIIAPRFDNHTWNMITYLNPGTEFPEHVHHFNDTFIFCLEGTGFITLKGETISLSQGTGIHIKRNTYHLIGSNKNESLKIISINSGLTPLSTNDNVIIDLVFRDKSLNTNNQWVNIFKKIRLKSIEFNEQLGSLEIPCFSN